MTVRLSDSRCAEEGGAGIGWRPPLDSGDLGKVLTSLRAWQPLDCDVVLDDVAAALDEILPGETGTSELVRRLHRHLGQLLDVAVATQTDQRDVYTADLVRQGADLRAVDMAVDSTMAAVHRRRIGWVTGELLDALVTAGCLKGTT